MARKLKLKCPICKKPVTSQDADFPFCGERCRLIDLGKWASGAYVVSTPINQGDQFGEADYTVDQGPDSKHDDNDRKRS